MSTLNLIFILLLFHSYFKNEEKEKVGYNFDERNIWQKHAFLWAYVRGLHWKPKQHKKYVLVTNSLFNRNSNSSKNKNRDRNIGKAFCGSQISRVESNWYFVLRNFSKIHLPTNSRNCGRKSRRIGKTIIFQQDGPCTHTFFRLRDWLDQTFSDRWTGLRGPLK